MHTWINDEWLLYSFENWSKDLFPQLLAEADSKTTKLLVTHHSFSMFAKFSEKLRNVSFSENFTYVLKV